MQELNLEYNKLAGKCKKKILERYLLGKTMSKEKKLNILKFPTSIHEPERQVEAILFAAEEPLDMELYELYNT